MTTARFVPYWKTPGVAETTVAIAPALATPPEVTPTTPSPITVSYGSSPLIWPGKATTKGIATPLTVTDVAPRVVGSGPDVAPTPAVTLVRLVPKMVTSEPGDTTRRKLAASVMAPMVGALAPAAAEAM